MCKNDECSIILTCNNWLTSKATFSNTANIRFVRKLFISSLRCCQNGSVHRPTTKYSSPPHPLIGLSGIDSSTLDTISVSFSSPAFTVLSSLDCDQYSRARNYSTAERPALYASTHQVLFPACVIPLWPWPLTFWPQNVKRSSLSHSASLM